MTRTTSPSAEEPDDRHNYDRLPVSISGRYMLEDKREFACRTTEMSSGGAALVAPVRGAVGERVIVYLDYIGRIEGSIVSHTRDGFAISLILPGNKREQIADRLTWLLNRELLRATDRRHDRLVPLLRHCVLLENGQERLVKLIDVSLSGAAIGTDLIIPDGSMVLLGATPGRVVRSFEGGMAIEFDTPLSIEGFDENVRL